MALAHSYLVGEIAKRTGDAVASMVGGTAGPLVATLMVSAAAVVKNPDLVYWSIPAGAAADALTEQGILVATQRVRNAAERIARFVHAVADEAGRPADEFIDEHITDANGREFLGRVVDAATVARSDWKVRVLARAFVRGAKDGDRIDETEMFIAVVRDLEPSHARLLAALDSLFREETSRFGASVRIVAKHDPGIGPAAALLWRHLRDHGLVIDVDPSSPGEGREDRFRPTDLGIAVAGWLSRLDIALDT